MKDVIKVYPRGIAYLGKKTERDGYVGACDRMFDAVTQTIIKPGASLEEVRRSLQLTLDDIDLRISHKDRIEQLPDADKGKKRG